MLISVLVPVYWLLCLLSCSIWNDTTQLEDSWNATWLEFSLRIVGWVIWNLDKSIRWKITDYYASLTGIRPIGLYVTNDFAPSNMLWSSVALNHLCPCAGLFMGLSELCHNLLAWCQLIIVKSLKGLIPHGLLDAYHLIYQQNDFPCGKEKPFYSQTYGLHLFV